MPLKVLIAKRFRFVQQALLIAKFAAICDQALGARAIARQVKSSAIQQKTLRTFVSAESCYQGASTSSFIQSSRHGIRKI
jgi:hypothetical protein